jgi:hypothetical protein
MEFEQNGNKEWILLSKECQRKVQETKNANQPTERRKARTEIKGTVAPD